MELWGPQQLAEYLSIPLATVYRWRTRRYGPPGVRMGKHVRYRKDDVERWVNSLVAGDANG
jgi:excisionase family DNA binding protein